MPPTFPYCFVCRSHRRNVFGLNFLICFLAALEISSASEQIEIEVREPAGLARRGYPAHALLELPKPVPASTGFRLLLQNKPIIAQFRPDGDGETSRWWLDFQNEVGPFESKRLIVEYGSDVTPGPERTSGHKLTTEDQAYTITNAPYITWTIPRDLKGLVRSVQFQEFQFLRSDSPGLVIRDRQSREFPLSAVGQVVRQGMMTVALRYQNVEKSESLAGVRSTVDLVLPGPVSWMEVDWNLDDPNDNVAAIGMQLNLDLDRTDTLPILTDFGTTGMVYLSLYGNQAAELVAHPGTGTFDSANQPFWQLLKIDNGKAVPFASAPQNATPQPVDGWLHVMDRKKCLALAIEGFARETRDRVRAGSDGKLTIWREFPSDNKSAQKRVRSWLHYVFFPPQQSAGSSPQQMQAPLRVRTVGH